MEETTKRIWDVVLNCAALLSAIVAFVAGIYQWRRSQNWQRADRLDKFVEKFEADELLRLAAAVTDWTSRKITFRGQEFTVQNHEALLALRYHEDITEAVKYPGNQPVLRDAYDALLAFLTRLELVIATGLVDAKPARQYFVYWLEHFLTFKRHPDGEQVLNGKTPQEAMARYIRKYGDADSIVRLCRHFGLSAQTLEASGTASVADAAPR